MLLSLTSKWETTAFLSRARIWVTICVFGKARLEVHLGTLPSAPTTSVSKVALGWLYITTFLRRCLEPYSILFRLGLTKT